MTYLSDMYIRDEELRKNLKIILALKTRNQIVQAIKSKGERMHQYNIDRFLSNKPVSLETLKKIDRYVSQELQLITNR